MDFRNTYMNTVEIQTYKTSKTTSALQTQVNSYQQTFPIGYCTSTSNYQLQNRASALQHRPTIDQIFPHQVLPVSQKAHRSSERQSPETGPGFFPSQPIKILSIPPSEYLLSSISATTETASKFSSVSPLVPLNHCLLGFLVTVPFYSV